MTTPPLSADAAAAQPDPSSPPPNAPEAVGPAGPRPGRMVGEADKFPIVALGGSAGALAGFELFFKNMPADSGLAFVVISHLLPGQNNELPAVLQRSTTMPVQQVQDGQRVRPNQVYVIPPDKDLSLLHGALLLLAPTQPPGRRLPIDYFLQSLAKDARERAVCILFSGLGADGVIGLKMVMENFGMVMVQSPETAEFDALPRAALGTEFVDFVLPADLLPGKLLEYVRKPLLARPSREATEAAEGKPAHALQKIFLLIRTQTGHDFSHYKRNTVFRRIERRMNSHQIKEFANYVRYLQENPQEVEHLFKELLIGVTRFFRDAEAFELLKRHLRPMLQTKPVDSTIRVWAPGCSTGEEAYSLAMTLLEGLDSVDPALYLKIQIFATDINAEGIDQARIGLYPGSIEADVNPGRLQRFFHKLNGHYQIRKEVRDVVVFALHDVNKDAPFTKLDLLCCRNLLIYLSAELQKNLLPIFHYALNPGALLLLGPSENITGFNDLFVPLDVKWKLSRRTDASTSLPRILNFPFSMARQYASGPQASAMIAASSLARRDGGPFATLVQKALLRTYAPPAVVINQKGEILYINGRTGKYLEPAPGLSGMNIFDMAREELNFELSGAVHRAYQQHEEVVVDNVKVRTDTGHQLLRLSVKPLGEPEALAGLVLVAFEDVPTPRKVRVAKADPAAPANSRDAAVATLDKELQYTKHRLQTTIEEMESSLEELKSTNEELQSANEELQSTNEEAMTNKEEMQSLNEELMTLNMQYLSKTEELSEAANDMKNLLDATEIATIFLDHDLTIKRFTPPVGRIVNLMPSDVGRPLAHFASNLRYEGLMADVQQVLDRLVSIETNIQTVAGERYAMRILPYRTLDNYISGAVITFTDVTSLKTLEARLQEAARYTQTLQDAMREPVADFDHDLRLGFLNRAFAELLQRRPAELLGQSLAALGPAATWDQPALRTALLALLDPASGSTGFDGLPLDVELPQQGRRRVELYGRRLQHEGQPTGRVLLGVSRVGGEPNEDRNNY
ncbi:CheR family methyltransferase [Hymenobacter sp. ASUV-10]|uniref:protein-glutamate O-methyltransferase n=1 Tax=Hymenobacter aranciens TaxID=3063996 RepID=A0ABT9BGS8_9BACT|nr:CheR family methyltransferase [Hymenobacter sp. ASUV-10]MDO7877475.1 CheR family methyltransferase [Hymenobacter sp. ASUV-10]